jgi:D-serine deaminase-like pyridoxal phosphate-dependent protein
MGIEVDRVGDLPTPAAVIDRTALRANLREMSLLLPGARLRPHAKAHKTFAICALQRAEGHPGVTCATPREAIGLVTAGVADDVLVANECLDPRRLARLADLRDRARVILAVDSAETIEAAARAGVRDVVVDVDVGLPRCGCDPDDAGWLADLARRSGLEVRGVMGYEGHLMMNVALDDKVSRFAASMDRLERAHALVGGDIVSSGGTGTHHLHAAGSPATEVQAGSYALMDTAYAVDGHPFRQALALVGTVVAAPRRGPLDHLVVDVGLKATSADHGMPSVAGARVRFLSDEHATVTPDELRVRVGDRIAVVPAHVDPTMALHDHVWVVQTPVGDDGEPADLATMSPDRLAELPIVDRWSVDLRGW